ncbi:MAG: hypothetical protein HUK24_01240, partial [Sphaerochaetaceae bacterium]|nr:hypothetical protein [Sphaerochaetaceae bacterium]
MKIQSLNKINKLLITVLFAFTLISCTSTTGQEADEIIKTAIDLGEKYNSLKLYDKSCEVYEKALEEVKDYRLYYNYSISLYCSGSYNEA